MDGATITPETFSISGPNAALVLSTVAYTDNTAVLSPDALLEANTLYTVTLTTGIKNLAGTAPAANMA